MSGLSGGPRTVTVSSSARELRLFMVAGEPSGDHLGGKLMAALNRRRRGRMRYLGVGGPAMEAEGLLSQFPLSDVAVMGPLAIAQRLPTLARRVWSTVDAVIAAEPDGLIIIDAPEFTHRVARRVRARRPAIPIIDYVSPSVWAWRPGRAQRMRAYVDHVLALLPFEPAVHERLGGPPCTYVGHPLIERHAAMLALDPGALARRLGLNRDRPVLVVLPGSRASEVLRLMAPFGQAIDRLMQRDIDLDVMIPAVPSVRELIEARIGDWPLKPHIIDGEDDKVRAFRLARAALAASGTVTLELALAGTPMVIGYRVDGVAALLRPLVKTPHFALSNLILDERAFPELMQGDCTPDKLADELHQILDDTPARARQLRALAEVPGRMLLANGREPSDFAADIVLSVVEQGRQV